jgi:hypothetical protein
MADGSHDGDDQAMEPFSSILLVAVMFVIPAALIIGLLLVLGAVVAGLADGATSGLVRPGSV